MKTALVTGTGSSMGREVALYLGAKGYKILTHGSKMKEPLETTHQLLKKANVPYSTCIADYTSLEEVNQICNQILANEKQLDAMIHIAGGANAFGHDKITPEQIIASININLNAPMIMTHKLLPLLTERSLIIFTSGLPGIHSGWYPTDACYDAAKGGLLRFAENLARNLGPKTRVNSIVIGLNYVDDNHKEWRAARAEQMPMKRIAYAEDYVKCIDFFLNHDYITGTSLRLDGGWFVYNPNPPFRTSKDWD
jgi:NAD(P)-dependent dehydrogenase (short-subunit alcohol dehydrogenase family)